MDFVSCFVLRLRVADYLDADTWTRLLLLQILLLSDVRRWKLRTEAR